MTAPQIRLAGLTRVLRAATTATMSPFSGVMQAQDWGGRWWEFEAQVSATIGPGGRALSVFLDGLGGVAGKFVLRDASHIPLTGRGTPTVAGAGQTGATLNTAGWTADAVALYAGEAFSVGSGVETRLYRATADITADGSGTAAIPILPPLRESPANAAALNITTPGCVCRLEGPVPTRIELADVHRFTFRAREAL